MCERAVSNELKMQNHEGALLVKGSILLNISEVYLTIMQIVFPAQHATFIDNSMHKHRLATLL